VQAARQQPPSERHCPPFAQAVHVPLHPSGSPHFFPVQFFWHFGQVPITQVPPSQGGVQQLSKQRPLEQKEPASHCTPEHGLLMHWPFTQTWLAPQVTEAQGSGGAQDRLQAVPGGHCTSQALIGTHWPVPGWQ
jgi:hypothetical protein